MSYDRDKALAYANRYWNKVCHDNQVAVKDKRTQRTTLFEIKKEMVWTRNIGHTGSCCAEPG